MTSPLPFRFASRRAMDLALLAQGTQGRSILRQLQRKMKVQPMRVPRAHEQALARCERPIDVVSCWLAREVGEG